MNVLSLFSGIDGLGLGLERAGMTVVGHVEKNPLCRSILARHWPHVPQHDDVTTFARWWTQEDRPHVDLVAGGFPCQPFSLAGLHRGVSDERWMWPAMADAIRVVRPSYVIVENVPALIRDRIAFGWLLGDLADLGFDAEWSLLSACAVGAPHARDRLLLVAYANSGDGEARVGTRQEPRLTRLARWPSARSYDRDAARAWRDRVDWAVEAACVDGRELDGAAAGLVEAAGNAVVPQVAEHIGRLIMEAHHAAA